MGEEKAVELLFLSGLHKFLILWSRGLTAVC